jgi:hypothetical protein
MMKRLAIQIGVSAILGIGAGLSVWLLVKLVGELLTRPPKHMAWIAIPCGPVGAVLRAKADGSWEWCDALDQPA